MTPPKLSIDFLLNTGYSPTKSTHTPKKEKKERSQPSTCVMLPPFCLFPSAPPSPLKRFCRFNRNSIIYDTDSYWHNTLAPFTCTDVLHTARAEGLHAGLLPCRVGHIRRLCIVALNGPHPCFFFLAPTAERADKNGELHLTHAIINSPTLRSSWTEVSSAQRGKRLTLDQVF